MNITRKEFLNRSSALAAASILTPLALHAKEFGFADKKIKIGVIGCGSVSRMYFPHLSKSPFVELVSACDIRPERAKIAAEKYKIPNHYPHIDQMLAGREIRFDGNAYRHAGTWKTQQAGCYWQAVTCGVRNRWRIRTKKVVNYWISQKAKDCEFGEHQP